MILDQHFVLGHPDKTDYPREICGHVLAHKPSDKVKAAYLRGAYLEECKGLMAY